MNRDLNRVNQVLADAWPDVPPGLPADRRRLVASVEMALARRSRRAFVQRRIFQVGFASAAALLLVATGWQISHLVDARRAAVVAGRSSSSSSSSSSSPSSGSRFAIDDASLRILQAPGTDSSGGAAIIVLPTSEAMLAVEGNPLEAGQKLDAPPAAEVRIGNARGTSLTLEPGSEVAIATQGNLQRYALERGAVRTRVARLAAAERFIVSTSDAEIEVHGTSFRVALAGADPRCGEGARTRVAVTEGVVSVRSRGIESFVAAGEEWPRGCAKALTTIAAAREAATLAEAEPYGGGVAAPSMGTPSAPRGGGYAAALHPDRRRVLRHVHRRRRVGHHGSALAASSTGPAEAELETAEVGLGSSISTSSLAAQNDLYTAGVRARKNGRAGEAVRLFSELIDRYPGSALMESAMVLRLRAMRDADPAGLSSAVAQYLGRFPAGFARAEAARMANPSPDSTP